MQNPYKRTDVFQCNLEAHRAFGGRVSVYHVLKEKHCYPQGCLYFEWHCTLLEKGSRCIHGYNYVGRNCRGCTYYLEEKIHLQPVLKISPETYAEFLETVESFDQWLEANRFRQRSISGRIHSIKPWIEETRHADGRHLRLLGYILVFKRGFIGMDAFDDTFYVRITERTMKSNHFLPKMKVEMTGEVLEDRGRIFIRKPGRFEILSRGWGRVMGRDAALVAMKTATYMEEQPDRCLGCRWGILVDVTDQSGRETLKYRSLYCLKGVADPVQCYVDAEHRLKRKKIRISQ